MNALVKMDFEKCVICRMIVDRNCVPIARGILEDGFDFKNTNYGSAYTALIEHYDKCEPWSIVSIGEKFMLSGVWDLIGEEDGYRSLVSEHHTSEDVDEYCRIIRRMALRRRLTDLLRKQTDAIDVDGVLSDITETKAELSSLSKKEGVLSGSEIAQQIIGKAVSGEVFEMPTPWRRLDVLAKPLRTGTVCLLVGNIGASKTFMLLQMLSQSVISGYPVKALFLEENDEHYIHRAWAQAEGCSDITSFEFIKSNADWLEESAARNSEFLDLIRPVITTSPEKMYSHQQCASWIEQQAISGARLIAVDPVTALDSKSNKPWEVHKQFIDRVKKIASQHQCCIVLLTHPVKAICFPSMAQVAGGAAYTQFLQTVLWLENHPAKTSLIKSACGSEDFEHERTLYILKSRNGDGTNIKLAFNFCRKSLTLSELGVICPKPKGKKDE